MYRSPVASDRVPALGFYVSTKDETRKRCRRRKWTIDLLACRSANILDELRVAQFSLRHNGTSDARRTFTRWNIERASRRGGKEMGKLREFAEEPIFYFYP